MSAFALILTGMHELANICHSEEFLTMSLKELSRLEVVQRLESKRLKQAGAAERLGLTARQVRRLQTLYRTHGAAGLVSRRRGRSSNNCIDASTKSQVLALLTTCYAGFGPTLAHEKLSEVHALHLSLESLRQLMIGEGLWKARRARAPVVHQMRERRAALGELVQIDGSPHAWLEDRGPLLTLLVFIDDATGLVQYLRFVRVEDTWNYFEAAGSYIRQHGKPCAFYSDKLSVFKVNAPETHVGQAITQFARAMQELDIELICANTPQAKGRVERMNQTLQDRLVKELRLLGICDMEQANLALPDFLTRLNQRFAVTPRSAHDAHRPLRRTEKLEQILTLQSKRVLSKNLTLQYENVIYQIKTPRPSYAMRQAQVQVCENRQGALTISYRGKELRHEVHHRQTSQARIVTSKEMNQRLLIPPSPPKRRPTGHAMPADHPWRRSMINPKGRPQVDAST